MLYYYLYRNSNVQLEKVMDYICFHFENMGYVTDRKRSEDGSTRIRVWEGSGFWGRGEIAFQVSGNQNEFWLIYMEKGMFASEFEGGLTAKKKQIKLNEEVHKAIPLIPQWIGAECVQHYQKEG